MTNESVYVRARTERERLAAKISDLQSIYLKTDAEWQTKAQGDVADTRNMPDATQARLVSLQKNTLRKQQ